MYGVLSCGGGLVAVAAAKGVPPPAALDLLLLDNFVASHDSFRLVRLQGAMLRSSGFRLLTCVQLRRALGWGA